MFVYIGKNEAVGLNLCKNGIIHFRPGNITERCCFNPANVGGLTAKYDYSEVLDLSFKFFEAQRWRCKGIWMGNRIFKAKSVWPESNY